MKKIFGRLLSVILVMVCISTVFVSSSIANAATKTSIKLDTTSYTFNQIGKSYIFLASISPNVSKGVNFSSNNSSVVTIQPVSHNSKGYYCKIISKGVGTTKINVKVNGVTSSFLVTVNNGAPIVPKSYSLNEPYYFKDAKGNNLYSLTINNVKQISERMQGYDVNPNQLLLIDYTYTNIAKTDGLFLTSNHFGIVDAKGFVGSEYLGYFAISDYKNHPQKIAVGTSCNAQVVFGIDNQSDKVTLQFKDDMFGVVNTSFVLNVLQV